MPIRADMATVVNGPMGISESVLMTRSAPPMPSALLHKRKELKDMLVTQLLKQHGSDPICKAVITREVESSATLRAGKLTSDGLATLERSVAEAVRATKPGPPQSLVAPRRSHEAVWSAGEMAEQVKKVSNWTDVATHRGKYYTIEQEKRAAASERRKAELRTKLDHMKRQERDRAMAEHAAIHEEARQVEANLAEYHADMAKVKEQQQAKIEQQRRDRAMQLKEQAARAAAADRLRKLEDEELLEHLRKEADVARQKKEEKDRANEEYHRQTAAANIKARELREQRKLDDWEVESKLNAEWKAVLDKQEADRTGQYERLRERIRKMQKAYEGKAGKEDEERAKAEEDRRNKWIEHEDRRLDELARTKKETRQQMISNTTSYLFSQMTQQEAVRETEVEEEKRYADSVRADVKLEEQRELDKKVLKRAHALQQQSHLNEQISLQRAQAARDPGASEMTALEASLNRGLLVSLVQHKYPNPHVLN